MTRTLDERPWASLPRDTAAVLAPALPALADEIIEAIRQGVPDYARPLEGPFGEGLRGGVEQALRRFIELIGRTDPDPDFGRQVYVDLGRGEMRAGRRLDALLAAYRLGARVAWRRLAAVGEQAGLDRQVLYLLAESIFAYIDGISSESVEGYAMEQAAQAGARQRRRRRLAALLVQDPPADAAAVEAAALDAGWPLPGRLAAIWSREGDADRVALRLGGGAIAAELADGTCALIPDPEAPGRRAQLEAAFADRRGALGPAVGWRDAALSAARSRAALALAEDGAIKVAATGLVRASEHPVELLVNADRRLARDIVDDALAPLEDQTPASRARLIATLAAWLGHQGRTDAVAASLHVHPQTVRYRLARLRELYGDRLDRADGRFELELALRARQGFAE